MRGSKPSLFILSRRPLSCLFRLAHSADQSKRDDDGREDEDEQEKLSRAGQKREGDFMIESEEFHLFGKRIRHGGRSELLEADCGKLESSEERDEYD